MMRRCSMLIEDGSGSGWKAAVGNDNKLRVCAVTRTMDLHCNQKLAKSYSLVMSQTPAGAGDCFGYVKNNDDEDMVISSIKVYGVSNEIFEIKLNDTGIPTGTDATPVNRKAGSGNVAEATCKVGNDITGLSGGSTVEVIPVKGGETATRYEWLSGLVVPKNHTLTLYVVTGGIAVRATLSMHFCLCE